MSESVHQALPQLLRAFRQGHRSHRGRLLRVIASTGDDVLSREPVLSVFRGLLHGDDGDKVRRLGDAMQEDGEEDEEEETNEQQV